jgi:D-sedoheptulose 7-phosphate isomerase
MEIKQIEQIIISSCNLKTEILKDKILLGKINEVAELITEAFKGDKKVLFCGNGGSAADAQHLAAELSGRFYIDREPLFAEALHVNTSYLTAVANDYNYNEVYARLIKAKGRTGDVIIGISTSGNSENIIRAFEEAKKIGVITVAMTGQTGGIKIPSSDTPRIQEVHILVGHIICQIIEENLFG